MTRLMFKARFVLFFSLLSAPCLWATEYAVGQYAEGGVIFWLEPSLQHGLVAAVVDQDGGEGVQWYNNTYILVHTIADGVYLGAADTEAVLAAQGEGTYAAKLAKNYSVTVEGVTYADWYLPCPTELALMYLNMQAINDTALANGGTPFAAQMYWTSADSTPDTAESQDFGTGSVNFRKKEAPLRVRAVRAF